jgi:hypothetical protein
VTLKGIVRLPLLLESGTANPPASAAEVREIVHDVVPGVFTVVVVQPRPLSVGGTDIETVPETPVAGMVLAAAVAATTPVI